MLQCKAVKATEAMLRCS